MMDFTLAKQYADKWALMPLSGDIGQSALLAVATATVSHIDLTEGCWEISILSGSAADQVSVMPQTTAAAAPLFAAINPIPATITDGLSCFRADKVVRLLINANQPRVHLAHSNAGSLTFLFCRVLA